MEDFDSFGLVYLSPSTKSCVRKIMSNECMQKDRNSLSYSFKVCNETIPIFKGSAQ